MKKTLNLVVLMTIAFLVITGTVLVASADPGPPAIVFELLCPGQIDIEPQEAGGNLVRCFEIPGPTETPTPTDTPLPPTATDTPVPPPTATATPDCSVLSMMHTSGTLFDITNSANITATITQVTVSWAGSGTLQQILFGGSLIKDLTPGASPIVIVTDFDGALAARQLNGPGTKEFGLVFSGQILAISVTVQFDGQCNLSVSI